MVRLLTVPVECIHPRKVLLAALARVRAYVEVQLLVPLAVMLARKALAAAGPLALVRLLLGVRAVLGRVQGLVSLAVVLSRKALAAAGPLARERALFGVRPQVAWRKLSVGAGVSSQYAPRRLKRRVKVLPVEHN